MLWTMPLPANIVLRNYGLAIFLAAVGINAGQPFVKTVAESGLTMLFIGVAILLTTVLIVLLVGYYLMKIPYDDLVGIASGATGNPAILVYSTRMAPTERPDIGYAMIFPSMTIVKVIAVQIVGLLALAPKLVPDAKPMNDLNPHDADRSPLTVTFDAVMPAALAARAEEAGVRRAATDPLNILVLSVLGGAFVAFGAIFATTVSAGSIAISSADGATQLAAGLPFGIVRLLVGLVFCVGLILVIVGGAELFTGNTLIVMAWASGKIKTRDILLNWLIAFGGNFIGAIGTAGLMFLTHAVYVWWRLSGTCRPDHREFEGGAGLRACSDARHHVQCTGLPGGMDVLRRTDDDRSRRHDHSADLRLRRRRIRALCRQYVLHSDGTFHQSRRIGVLLERHRENGIRFSGSHLAQFSHRQPCSGDNRKHHRRFDHGRRRLLVCVSAQETAGIDRIRGNTWFGTAVE